MRVLVTGGAGFIGSNLVPHLLNHNHSVTVIDNLYTGKLENLSPVIENKNFHFIKGDIRDQTIPAMTDIDAIVHLAALIDVTSSVTDPKLTHDVNVTGTLNLLEQAVKNKVNKVVFASSTAVYGDVKTLPVTENTPLQPISPYAASKAACEAYLTAFAKCYNLKTVALRFFNVYGPKNENSPYSGVITKFLRKTLNNETLPIEGDGEQTRDFIHVNDIVNALTLALESSANVTGEAFNICTGTPISINTLANTLSTVTNKQLKTIYKPPRVGDIKYSYGDPSKAKNLVGFQSKITLLDGLKLLYEQTTTLNP